MLPEPLAAYDSFYPVCQTVQAAELPEIDTPVSPQSEAAVRRVLNKPTLTIQDFALLLSPAATPLLEEMAQKASQLTMQHFGRTIQLFTPLYLSDYCTNHCIYCGFNACNTLNRSKLTMEQLQQEAEAIVAMGIKHLLILTGEAPAKAGVDYLKECMEVLRPMFPSVSIEVYAMTQDEYIQMVNAGIDGLTMFQETYNEPLYAQLHPKGPKRDFRFRLDAPERGCKAGMRVVNIGALLGLDEWRRETVLTALHAHYLQTKYPDVDVAISLPRMRPHAGEFQPASIVDDRQMVQIMVALRLFMPRVGITISTREAPEFRENILPLGVTKMSAGVSTAVGGHSQKDEKVGQFDISDERSVEEMCTVLRAHGVQPVFKDWEPLGAMDQSRTPKAAV